MEQNMTSEVVEDAIVEAVNRATDKDQKVKSLIGLGIAMVAGFLLAEPVKKALGKIFKKKYVEVENFDEATEKEITEDDSEE